MPAENGGYHKSPVPLPSTPSPDISPTLQESKSHHQPRGYGKPPALPPPTNDSPSHSASGDYPPYDRLIPIAQGDFPAYDRLKPITLLSYPPSPNPPSEVESVPPIPSRTASDVQPLKPNPPPVPPKQPKAPPIPPKGTH